MIMNRPYITTNRPRMTIQMKVNALKNIVDVINLDNGNKKLKYGDITKTVSFSQLRTLVYGPYFESGQKS